MPCDMSRLYLFYLDISWVLTSSLSEIQQLCKDTEDDSKMIDSRIDQTCDCSYRVYTQKQPHVYIFTSGYPLDATIPQPAQKAALPEPAAVGAPGGAWSDTIFVATQRRAIPRAARAMIDVDHPVRSNQVRVEVPMAMRQSCTSTLSARIAQSADSTCTDGVCGLIRKSPSKRAGRTTDSGGSPNIIQHCAAVQRK
ncbi:hypothetical protein GGX14DRAFT_400412 [Mycena pura]|uniref:Uncharacterized protein n=1 Tax=Mycena pura TaxID=153505 RepID=A0AAD6YBI1_9AGAR|nr:hypothetical protein GGX14DRAFT_400412 [Mycena pura]